ncbi:hypothetical protein H4R19_000667 [Coemansia spiralis]|nr:hypothetical protein H4R19_000667 [Coemansia spiralis]
MAYDTVFIKCGTQGESYENGPEDVDIATSLDLLVGAKCHHLARELRIDVHFQADPLPGFKAAISRLREVCDEWVGVRKLSIGLHLEKWVPHYRGPRVANHEADIASIGSDLAALLPGVREICIGGHKQLEATCVMLGRLVGLYSHQLQVLHSKHALAMPQDRVFNQLRDVSIGNALSDELEHQLPRLDPEVIESLVLGRFMPDEVWSMFCADPDCHETTFPRLTDLSVTFCPSFPNPESPWALQFPAAKRVCIESYDPNCLSMANAVFPACLESLEVSAGLGLLRAFASARVRVTQGLAIYEVSDPDHNDDMFGIINSIFDAAGPCRLTNLYVGGVDPVPLDLFTYTGLTHLSLSMLTSVGDVMSHIRTQPRLVSLEIDYLSLADIQADFSIPDNADHEPVAPLDTQLRELTIYVGHGPEPAELAYAMLKYLLLKIPTLSLVTTGGVSQQPIQDFIDEYAQWYPHLANIKLEN